MQLHQQPKKKVKPRRDCPYKQIAFCLIFEEWRDWRGRACKRVNCSHNTLVVPVQGCQPDHIAFEAGTGSFQRAVGRQRKAEGVKLISFVSFQSESTVRAM